MPIPRPILVCSNLISMRNAHYMISVSIPPLSIWLAA